MRLACFAWAALASLMGLSAPSSSFEIGTALLDAPFWDADPVLFVSKHRQSGFKFTSDTRENADSRLDGGVTCFGAAVYESRIDFAGSEGLEHVELSLYNSAGTEKVEEVDLGEGRRLRRIARSEKPLTRDEFLQVLQGVRQALTPEGRKNPLPVAERAGGRGVVQKSQTWRRTAPDLFLRLTWNYRQDGNRKDTFRGNFIRLSVDGPRRLAAGKGKVSVKGSLKAKGRQAVADNVIRDPRGDVFVDNVPMVDQGAKGYCAVAAAERVLRYYGVEVDEHEIGQSAGTTADGGTSSLKMKEAVEDIGRRHKLSTVVLYGNFEKSVRERIAGLEKEVADYNKAAKKLRRPAITPEMYVTREGNMISYSYSAVDEKMEGEVLKEMKVNGSQKARYKKFMADVHQYVNLGMPLFWSVTLGTYPESDLPQAKGGHTRLIIGYNDKKREILYSDTWGKGHELKRMPADWAWTISNVLMVMKPRQ